MSLREKFCSIFKKDDDEDIVAGLEAKVESLTLEVENLQKEVVEIKQEVFTLTKGETSVDEPVEEPRKLTPKEIISQIPNLEELAKDPNVSQTSVAKKYGVYQSNISSYCKSHNIRWVTGSPYKEYRGGNYIKQKIQYEFTNEKEFLKYCDTHYVYEICEKIGVSEDTLRKYLQEVGHTRPTHWEIKKFKEHEKNKKEMPTDFAQWGIVKVLDSKGRAYYEKILQSKEFLTREGKLKKISELTNYDVQYIEWYFQLRGIRY